MSIVNFPPDRSFTPPTHPRAPGPTGEAAGATVVLTAAKERASIPDPEPGWPRLRGYDILALVGRGGMGNVYKARQRHLNRLVAVKTLRAPDLDEESRGRFQSEAEAVARLQHPNIIQVFEVGSADPAGHGPPSPFIALEYVDGGSLVEHTRHPQPPREAAAMVAKLARAVDAAHRLGIIHRDLKPANVLLTRDGEPKIADFGLAKQLCPDRDPAGRFLTQAGTIVGTPEYMAPEQASGDPATPAADVYALGVILFELLTARVPFQAANPIETMHLVRTQEPVSPRQFQPSLPRDLETICLKCLEKEPGRRYADALALAEDLDCFLAHHPIRARRVGPVGRARRWCKRNPVPAAALAGVIAVLSLAFTAVTRSYFRAEAARAEAVEWGKAERTESYRANIAAAATALQVYDVDGARRTLAAAPADHRNWEWRHFQARLDQAVAVSPPLAADFRRVVFSPGGRYAVRERAAETRVFWDLTRQQPGREIAGVGGWAPCNNDQSYATVEPDRTVAMREVSTGRVERVLRTGGPPITSVHPAAAAPRVVAMAGTQVVCVWDARTDQVARCIALPSPAHRGPDVSPDGRWFAIDQNDGKDVTVWDAASGRPVSALPGHLFGVFGSKFNAAGDRVLTVEAFPRNCVRLWEPATGVEIATLDGHRNTLTAVAFSQNGAHVATASLDQTARVWDGRTGRLVAVLKGHLGQVNSVDFRADGRRLVTAGSDRTVRVWDVPTGDLLAVLPATVRDFSGARFLPDGGVVAAAGDGSLLTWGPRTVEGDGVLRGHTSFVYGVAFHPDGRRVASASWDGTARVWDADTGEHLRTFRPGSPDIVTSVAFHPAGNVLATRSRAAVVLWDVDSGRELYRWPVRTGGWKDTRLAFSPDGSRLAAGCGELMVRVWDVATRAEVARLGGFADEVRDVVFSPDGRFLAAIADGADHRVHVWDAGRWERVAVLDGHTGCGYALAFNRAGTLLASSATDARVCLWSTATWQPVAELPHDVAAYGLAFSADGSRLVSACADSSMRFWDVATHRLVATVRGDNQYYHQAVFSPDGTRLVGACGDCTVRIWDTVPARHRLVR